MDRNAFDGLTKLLATSPSRRKALAALLVAGLAGVRGSIEAKPHRGSGKAMVSAQATCANPGPSANLSGCNFNSEDFSGDDLSSSKLVGTTFRNANLVRTNLSSSNAKTADFRNANLTCANLRSSTLGGANFNGANLSLATLNSSGGCNTASFNAATTFCATTMCDGSVRNDDCPNGFDPSKACCGDADCGSGTLCVSNQCARTCPITFHASPCKCRDSVGGTGTYCVNATSLCFTPACTSDAQCASGSHCIQTACSDGDGRCGPPCPSPDACVCKPGSFFDSCGSTD